LGAGLSVGLSKSESPEVKVSGFGLCSGDISGVDLFPGVVSGFHQVTLQLGPNRLRLQELKEYSVSYSTLDYLRPVLGSKCLVTQTMGDYLRLGPLEETTEKMFQVATQIFNLLYYFPYM
jgi:hypothetical protein